MKEVRISWSGLQRFEKCHHKHYHVMNGRSSKVKDVRVFFPGTLADRVMRAFLQSENPQPGQMIKSLPEWWERLTTVDAEGVIKWRGDPRVDKSKILNQVARALTRLEPFLFEYVLDPSFGYQAEMKFKQEVGVPYLDGKLARIYLIGGIDIAVKRSEDWYDLFDLKMTENSQYLSSQIGQSVFYSLALSHMLKDQKQPKRFGFVSPATTQMLHWSNVTDDAKRIMASRITRMAQSIWREEWEPTVSSECGFCDVRHVCSALAINVNQENGLNKVSFSRGATT